MAIEIFPWYPTFVDIDETWTPAASDLHGGVLVDGEPTDDSPDWTGTPRGLFRFRAAIPARTHGGLPTQPPVEARIGRELPDPTFSYQDVYYWEREPRLFQVRNLSDDPVTVEFNGFECVGLPTQRVLAGETYEFGPCYYPAFGGMARVHVFGDTVLYPGVRHVQADVDVRVQGSGEADPGESFDFSCRAPAVVQL